MHELHYVVVPLCAKLLCWFIPPSDASLCSGLKAYKRGYIYWYMHMIAPPSEDNVGHFFKVQKSRMMLLHVCVHIHTVCVCVAMCVCVFNFS